MSEFVHALFLPDDFPGEKERNVIFSSLNALNGEFADRARISYKTLGSIFDEADFWSGSATDGLVAILGYNDEEKTVQLALGQGESHALLGGTTGSGKSNLIHVIIHSLCYRYSPEELKLFLLDYKDGLEFKKYTKNGKVWLPHAETISTHNDPAYAVSMFDYLQQECMRRRKAFGEASSYREFRKRGGKMPRIVIIIDEFHKLFEGASRDAVGERVMQVLKQGRAYGIHLIMATQTLASLEITNLNAMMAQIPIRMALRGGCDDRILVPENCAATEIKIPQCIYNDQFGKVSGNHLCRIPEVVFMLEPGKEEQFKSEKRFHDLIVTATAKASVTYPSKLFNGTILPLMPNDGDSLTALTNATDGFAIQIGVKNDYTAEQVFAVLDDSPSGHLVVAAPSGDGSLDDNGLITCDSVWNAVRDTMIHSLSVMSDIDVAYYSPVKDPSGLGLPLTWKILPPKASAEDLLSALKMLRDSDKQHKVFFVENFEKASKLQPADDDFSGRHSYLDAPQEPVESASSVFGSVFCRCESMPFHVVIMVRNFTYAKDNVFRFETSRSSINILNNFSQRIAINLSSDDLGRLYPQCYGRDVAKKIFFGSTDTDELMQFLPFKK